MNIHEKKKLARNKRNTETEVMKKFMNLLLATVVATAL